MALDKDPHSMSTQSLSKAANDPDHPMHMHAKIELQRRKGEMQEISLDDLKAKISSSGMKSTKKAMGADKLKKDLAAMKAKLATENVEWVCGKCNCDPCTCGDKIEEKTLTPAEKRKREKIAKAIERDNPDMPMDKKMAIATATAKRVAEVSSNKLGDYMRASSKDVAKSRGDARRQDKRIAGQSMADKKIRKKMGYSSTAKVPASKNEQADPDTVRMYKDNPDMMKKGGPGGMKGLNKSAQKDVKAAMKKEQTNLARIRTILDRNKK